MRRLFRRLKTRFPKQTAQLARSQQGANTYCCPAPGALGSVQHPCSPAACMVQDFGNTAHVRIYNCMYQKATTCQIPCYAVTCIRDCVKTYACSVHKVQNNPNRHGNARTGKCRPDTAVQPCATSTAFVNTCNHDHGSTNMRQDWYMLWVLVLAMVLHGCYS